MSKRRYSYSYSPTPRRDLKRGKSKPISGWVLLGALSVVVIAAVVMQQWFAKGGEGESFAAESPCWLEVACSAERVEVRETPRATDAAPDAPDKQARTDEDYGPLPATPGDELPRQEADPPGIAAYAAAVLEEPCGALVHGFNEDERYSPASLTKIATALVAAERVDLRQTVGITVDGGALSAENDATVMGLTPGQSMSMTDLLYGMMLPSGNDAAIQIAEQVAGSAEAFSTLMNAHVQDMGLKDTQFKNPHGLDEPGHYTSAFDIARLGAELLDNPTLSYIVSRRAHQPLWDGPILHNLNLLLGQYPGALGVKTGYTDQAGQTLVAAAERNGRRYVVAILGSQDIFVDATSLLDWAFASAPPSCGPVGGSQVAANP
jgi:D-alanyl-D-alanine carboxypeptidase